MEFIEQLLGENIETALFVIFNLIIIESLLSVDNAAVLATMVMDLPKNQRSKALKYGIIGAYVFRGLALIFAAWIMQIWWLKPIGGAYLLFLALSFFIGKYRPEDSSEEFKDKKKSFIYRSTLGLFGHFWATVILIEVMDMAFSIDNVFAAVAFTDKIVLVCIGVFIGILSMRFVAQGFVKLMERFPFLETAAYLVIGVLGLKLSTSLYTHFFKETAVSKFLESEHTDLYVSIITVLIFTIPILGSLLFNYPAKQSVKEIEKKQAEEVDKNQ